MGSPDSYQQPNYPYSEQNQGYSQNYQHSNSQAYQEGYRQPFHSSYTQPGQVQHGTFGQFDTDVSVGEWIVTYLIMMIPLVNIVMMFVWAFGSIEKRSKANYFKALLIVTAVSTGLIILGFIVFAGLLARFLPMLQLGY